MQNESTIDPKIIEEVLKFSRNVIEAPKFVSAPDEINLEVTPHKVVQQIDKTRLLHYKPISGTKHKTMINIIIIIFVRNTFLVYQWFTWI